MRILFIGDIVGSPGRKMIFDHLARLISEHNIDFVIANGENTSAGFGLNQRNYRELVDCGIDCFTMGNHTWDNKEIYRFIENETRIVRPANYAPNMPGVGWREFDVAGRRLIVTNLIGRVYMTPFDCPFRTMQALLKEWQADDAAIFVDIHAEATSEKLALGFYLDGQVAAIVGTHTHVQTNDARILPKGSGYLSDAGMTGPRDSILGVDKDIIIERFLSGVSPRFEVANGDLQFNGVVYDIGDDNKCQGVELINFWQPAL